MHWRLAKKFKNFNLQDGTILVHTIKQGLMLYNLQPTVPNNCDSFTVLHVATSYQGRIVVCVEENYSADHEVKTFWLFHREKHKIYGFVQKNYSLHMYSVNGKAICRDVISVEPVGLHIDSDHIVTAHSNGLVSIRTLTRFDLYAVT